MTKYYSGSYFTERLKGRPENLWVNPTALRFLLALALCVAGAFSVLVTSPAYAQESSIPIVNIGSPSDQVSVAEGDDATFILTRTGDTSNTLTIKVRTHEPHHPDALDDEGVPLPLADNPTLTEHDVAFPANSSTATMKVTISLDSVREDADLLIAELLESNDNSYELGNPIEVYLLVDDTPPVITVAADQTSVTEGAEVSFTFTRTGPTTRTHAVNITVSDPGSFLRGDHWQRTPALPTQVEFAEDSATATLSFQTWNDFRDIPDNSISVEIRQGNGYRLKETDGVAEANSASITIQDNDTAPELVLAASATTIEEGETATITIREIGGGRPGAVVFPIERGYRGNLTTEGDGFDGVETELKYTIETDDNDVDEIDRVYEFNLLRFPGGFSTAIQDEYWTISGPSSVAITVADNDLPIVGIEADDEPVLEGSNAWFRITRAGRTDHDLVVNTRADEDGNHIVHYQEWRLGRDRTTTLRASKETVAVWFTTEYADGAEVDGAVTMKLLPGDTYRIDPDRASASLEVIDTDPSPVLTIEDASVSEDGGSLVFTVKRTAELPPLRDITVDYATADATATSGSDYTAASGAITFDREEGPRAGVSVPARDNPHVTTKTISVPITDDALAEDDETFTLTLSNASGGVFLDGETSVTVTGTIEDDEPTVMIAAASAEITEGDTATFNLSRTGSTASELTVYLLILTRGAGPVTTATQEITFAAGASTATWTQTTVDDDLDRDHGLIIASVVPPDRLKPPKPKVYGTDANSSSATVTVKDNDLPEVTITADHHDRTEGEDVVYTLTRDGYNRDSLTVGVSVTGGDDFVTGTRPTTVKFAAGSATATLTVSTENDTPVDDHDVVLAAITSGAGYRIGDPGSAGVTLFDTQRSYTTLSIRANSSLVDEGADAVFTLTRSAYGLSDSLTISVRTWETVWKGVTTVYSGYPGYEDQITHQSKVINSKKVNVVFPAGSRTTTLTVSTVDEELNDGNSEVWAEIQLGEHAIRTRGRTARLWVRDDDLPTVTTDSATVERFEDPPNSQPFTVHRTGDTSGKLPLTWTHYVDERWPEGALSPENQAKVDKRRILRTEWGNLGTFYPGNSSHTFKQEPRGVGPLGATVYLEVLPRDCGMEAPGECVYAPQYKVGTPNTTTMEVLNQDPGVRVEATQEAVTEGESVSFVLHRYGGNDQARAKALTVRVQVTQAGEFISGGTPQEVTFKAAELIAEGSEGDLSATVTIQTTDDMLDEENGTITLTILPPDPADFGVDETSYEIFGAETYLKVSGYTNVATVRVLDNDEQGFSIADATVSEDVSSGTIDLTVALSNESSRQISVDWSTADSSGANPATAGEDYESAGGTLTFAAGEVSKTITVTILDDDYREEDETFTITLSNPVNAEIPDPSATVTITNDDGWQILSIASAPTEVVEGESVVFELSRCTDLGSNECVQDDTDPRGRLEVDLQWTTTGNYFSSDLPATAVFESGSWTTTVTVPTVDDHLYEPDKGSVVIRLKSIPGNQADTGHQTRTVNVWDNDIPIYLYALETDGADEYQVSSTEILESDGRVQFVAVLPRSWPREVSVDLDTVDGTATSHGLFSATDFGPDFEARNERIVFGPNVRERRFTVDVRNDKWDEAAEDFTVRISNPSGGRVGLLRGVVHVTIKDDDPNLVARLVPPAIRRMPEGTDDPGAFHGPARARHNGLHRASGAGGMESGGRQGDPRRGLCGGRRSPQIPSWAFLRGL